VSLKILTNWNDKSKRRWAFLLYKRLEIIKEEINTTNEILLSLGAPTKETLEKEFKLKGEDELNKFMNS